MKQYLATRVNLQHVYWVLDASHRFLPMTWRDVEYYIWMRRYNVPHTIVATKIDRIDPGHLSRWMQVVRAVLCECDDALELPRPRYRPMLGISSHTGHGIKELMFDMVYHAANDLSENQLCLKAFSQLTYTPMRTTTALAAEGHLSPRSQLECESFHRRNPHSVLDEERYAQQSASSQLPVNRFQNMILATPENVNSGETSARKASDKVVVKSSSQPDVIPSLPPTLAGRSVSPNFTWNLPKDSKKSE